MNNKNLLTTYIILIIVILLVAVSATTFFVKSKKENSYISIVDVKLSKSLDHIFLAGSIDSQMEKFATRYFRNQFSEYNWTYTSANAIEAKFYTNNKNDFYETELPLFKKKIIDSIEPLNKLISRTFKELYKDEVAQAIMEEDKSINRMLIWGLSEKPFYVKDLKTKVKFRKKQLTIYEFIAVTFFLSFTALSLITAIYIIRKKKNNNQNT